MNLTQAMKALEAAGTAQTRKTYGRHRVVGPMFGVSYATLGKLVKTIKTDHALALELFDTGNHDARVLATMIADPERLTAKTLHAWAKTSRDFAIALAVGGIAAKAPAGQSCAAKWIRSKQEFVATTGWFAVARLGANDELPDAWFEAHLATIEAGIHAAQNGVRYAMNSALIAIGCRRALTAQALAAAKRIGAVEVDHGDTECKTPDAVSYIAKAVAHRGRKTAKKKATRSAR